VKFSLKNPEKKTTIKLEKFSRQLQHDVKISKLPGGLSKRYQPLQYFKRMLRTALTLNPFGNRQREQDRGCILYGSCDGWCVAWLLQSIYLI